MNWLLHFKPAFWLINKKEYYLCKTRVQSGVVVTVIDDKETYTSEEIGQILGGN